MPGISMHARTAYLLLRVGAAFAFLYPPLSALMGDPNAWIGYFPVFLRGVMDDVVMLHLFGAIELVIGLWILSGVRIFLPSLAATALLLAIVAFNVPQLDVLFRDLSIAALTLSLALMHWPAQKPHVR